MAFAGAKQQQKCIYLWISKRGCTRLPFGSHLGVFFQRRGQRDTTGNNQSCGWFSAVLAQNFLTMVQSVKL